MKLLFICQANICRSFMAQEFFKQLVPQHVAFSRGLYADPSYEVPFKVRQALQAHHIPFTGHTSTQLAPADLQQADLIFCMEQPHADLLLDRYAQYTDKIWLLTDFACGKPQDLPDPIALEGRAFAKYAQRLYQICQEAAHRLQQDFVS